MSIRIDRTGTTHAWLPQPAAHTAMTEGGGLAVLAWCRCQGCDLRAMAGRRWSASEATEMLGRAYHGLGLRWESITIYTDDDRAHTLPASPDEAPEGWRPMFTTESR